MPKIDLKPQSPDFADDNSGLLVHECNMPECREKASHKAPKDRSLSEYYYFCLEHVQEYNKAWNFFSGISQSDMEEEMERSNLWDRPTWSYKSGTEDELRSKAWQTYTYADKAAETKDKAKSKDDQKPQDVSPEFDAMDIMGLTPPIDLHILKKRYKRLVKQHHPDVNLNDPNAEDLIKSINMAYTILKIAYSKYEELPEDKK